MPERPPIPPVLRRLLLWTLVCGVSAGPSFVIAAEQHDVAAMVLAICLFILAYTAVTSTERFERFHRWPFVRRTLYIGYGTRVGISIVFPIAMFPDIFAGATSIGIVRNVFGMEPQTFAGTFLTTCVSGTLLNALIFAFMLVVYALQRALVRPPEEPRGFQVVMPTAVQPATAVPVIASAPTVPPGAAQ